MMFICKQLHADVKKNYTHDFILHLPIPNFYTKLFILSAA